MRLIVDSLIALMLVGVFVGVLMHYRHEQRRLEDVRFVHQSLARLQEEITYHGALKQAQSGEARAFPERVTPGWFGDELPLNVLVSTRQPWIDIAPADDLAEHPPDPVVQNDDQAGFWYNPNRGVFRARVPEAASKQKTLELYNRVNGTALLALPDGSSSARAPEPNPIAPEPNKRRAARERRAGGVNHTLDSLNTVTQAVLPTPVSAHASARSSDASGGMPDEVSASAESDSAPPPPDGAEAADEPDESDGPDQSKPERPTLLDQRKTRGE